MTTPTTPLPLPTLLHSVKTSLNLLFTPVLYYGVIASISLQLATWEKGDRTQDRIQAKNDAANNDNNVFDFIIVGGGTSGSILANRLSAHPAHFRVLLLEAGGEPSPLQFVPGLARYIVGHKEVDWRHKTVAQKKAFGFGEFRRGTISAGLGLGGSGSIDFLSYSRGHPEDYDNWARISKDPRWKFENLGGFFRGGFGSGRNASDDSTHLSKSDYLPLSKQFLAAAKEFGYDEDLFSSTTSPLLRGQRQSPSSTFLSSAIRKRKNLVIRKFALVTKLLFKPSTTNTTTTTPNKKIHGITYTHHTHNNPPKTAYATKEVLLSAGALGSPKLLLLSGIGPSRHLESLGIPTIVNLPAVGQNLQDHVGTYLGPFFINEPELVFSQKRDLQAKSYVDYGTSGSGPLTSPLFSAVGVAASNYAKGRGEGHWPDLNFGLFPTNVDDAGEFSGDLARMHGLRGDLLKRYYKHAEGRSSFHVFVGVGRPAGRGTLTLPSRSPTDPLIINPRYFSDPWDLDIRAGVSGIKTILRMIEGSTTFQNIGARFTSEVLPGCESTKFRSDEYFECYLRHFTVSMFNPVGTCAMGVGKSVFAVVDSELKVIGVEGVRVVDASVVPAILGGGAGGGGGGEGAGGWGTGGAVGVVAERAAELVLDEWAMGKGKGVKGDFEKSNEIVDSEGEESRAVSNVAVVKKEENQKSTGSFASILKSLKTVETAALDLSRGFEIFSGRRPVKLNSVEIRSAGESSSRLDSVRKNSVAAATTQPPMKKKVTTDSIIGEILKESAPLFNKNYSSSGFSSFTVPIVKSENQLEKSPPTTPPRREEITTQFTIQKATQEVAPKWIDYQTPTTFRPETQTELVLMDPETRAVFRPTELFGGGGSSGSGQMQGQSQGQKLFFFQDYLPQNYQGNYHKSKPNYNNYYRYQNNNNLNYLNPNNYDLISGSNNRLARIPRRDRYQERPIRTHMNEHLSVGKVRKRVVRPLLGQRERVVQERIRGGMRVRGGGGSKGVVQKGGGVEPSFQIMRADVLYESGGGGGEGWIEEEELL